MIFNKKERLLMNAIYSSASASGQCLITPLEILSLIPYKADFREEDIDKTLEALKVDGYFAYDKALRKDETVYCIVLKEKGLSYERDKRTAKRKIIQRVALTIAFALLGYLIKVEGIEEGKRTQVLLGVTGSGKTFTMANVIARCGKPALVIAHNKTLAAQLCNEFRELFPHNRVEYFVSYYDYYQPEAYIPRSDTYIEKEIEVNDEIDIYGLGAPGEYFKHVVSIREGDTRERDDIIDKLVEIQYKRSDIDFVRGTFRARGDSLEIFPASSSTVAIRVSFFGDEVESIAEFDTVTGKAINYVQHVAIYPATHYVVGSDKLEGTLEEIHFDMEAREAEFTAANKLIEAQRIRERVNYDIEMIREMGYCSGIENYSRYFDGRKPGEPPYTLIDYFNEDFIVFVDESHITLPQLRGMYNGDRMRKTNLVEYGFRLPAAFDNRPLNFDEFNARVKQLLYAFPLLPRSTSSAKRAAKWWSSF